MVSPTRKANLQKKILSFYSKNKRNLPWRKTKNPYYILLSEVMLQQTQVDRVIPYYNKFLRKYPTIEHLAKARKRTLLKMWSGLGYNNRILRLQQLAKEVLKKHNGKLPKTEGELLALPGIGPYTANAILAFAHNQPVPVMDTNIRRVLIHELNLKETISDDKLKSVALQVIPNKKICIWHNALMDYGALEKTARTTGIKPLSRQSKFEGSNRQVRGEIVRMLLKKEEIPLATLRNQFAAHDISSIVASMVNDNLLQKKGGSISIK